MVERIGNLLLDVRHPAPEVRHNLRALLIRQWFINTFLFHGGLGIMSGARKIYRSPVPLTIYSHGLFIVEEGGALSYCLISVLFISLVNKGGGRTGAPP